MTDDEWSLQTLLNLNGQILEVGGGYWYKIVAYRVPPSPAVPHGISYSLTLHTLDGPRVYGIDNAHAPKVTGERTGPGRARRVEFDHQHSGAKVSYYEYVSAEDLLADFFAKVDAILKEKKGAVMTERIVKVGIATYEHQKARVMSIARGEYKPAPDEPKIWFSSIESFAQVLSTKNQLLLEMIAKAKPASVSELETLSGRKGPNLSRTLKTLARFGLVELRREGRSLVPRAVYDRISVDLPLLAAAHHQGALPA